MLVFTLPDLYSLLLEVLWVVLPLSWNTTKSCNKLLAHGYLNQQSWEDVWYVPNLRASRLYLVEFYGWVGSRKCILDSTLVESKGIFLRVTRSGI